MDRGAWQAIVHRVAQSPTQLRQLSTAQHIVQLTNHHNNRENLRGQFSYPCFVKEEPKLRDITFPMSHS